MKRIILGLLGIAIWCSCTPIRAIRWWQPSLRDSSKFAKSEIPASIAPFRFVQSTGQIKYLKLERYLDSMLKNSNTNAFMVIKNDTIIYENFAENLSAKTLHPSFSVAKSYVGTLVGIAIDKGIITSSNDLVIKYLPELAKNDNRFQKLTIQHVLDMRSGLDFDEDKQTPFAGIAKLYYGSSLKNQIAKLKMKREAGIAFEYQSINTQLLAAILETASGEKVPDLLAKYLWTPLGPESNAIWSLDDQNTVKSFCCLNATATDFAKLGRLYLKNGNWQGKQLISEQWVSATTNPTSLASLGYKNQWWACSNISYFKDSASAQQMIDQMKLKVPIRKRSNGTYFISQKANDYRAEGILGQIVYVNPDNNVIIVRMGDYPDKNLYFNGFIPKIGREIN